jgi:MFS family permease
MVLLQATNTAVLFQLPLIARKEFDAQNYQTTLITAAPTVMAVLSIFWHALFQRLSTPVYLALFWLLSAAPLALAALPAGFGFFATMAVLCAAGSAGWIAVASHLLKQLYTDSARARVFAVLTGATLVGGAAASWGFGKALAADPLAFRWLLPLVAAVQGVGIGLLGLLLRSAASAVGTSPRAAPPEALQPGGPRPTLWETAIRPVLNMGSLLRSDRLFARYEAAFMTYGVGWMICYALLPLIVTTELGLGYDQAAKSTSVVYLVVQLLMLWPAGLLIDRLGAPRLCIVAFGLYALYPLGLLLTNSIDQLAVATIFYGVCSAAVNMGWMLGPVNFAPTPDKVPQYVAIHATLVGLRGAVFQMLGVFLYTVTGSLAVPLLIAAAAFLWASWQMRQLSRLMPARA